jgi:hypothetical protein
MPPENVHVHIRKVERLFEGALAALCWWGDAIEGCRGRRHVHGLRSSRLVAAMVGRGQVFGGEAGVVQIGDGFRDGTEVTRAVHPSHWQDHWESHKWFLIGIRGEDGTKAGDFVQQDPEPAITSATRLVWIDKQG